MRHSQYRLRLPALAQHAGQGGGGGARKSMSCPGSKSLLVRSCDARSPWSGSCDDGCLAICRFFASLQKVGTNDSFCCDGAPGVTLR